MKTKTRRAIPGLWIAACVLLLCMVSAIGLHAQVVNIPRGGEVTIDFPVRKLCIADCPVQLAFIFPPKGGQPFVNGAYRPEHSVEGGLLPSFDVLPVLYSGKIYNARGVDDPATIVFEGKTQKELAEFKPTMFPAPGDGRIFVKLKARILWHGSPDAGRYAGNIFIKKTRRPDKAAEWTNLYPQDFKRLALFAGRNVHSVRAAGESAEAAANPRERIEQVRSRMKSRQNREGK